MSTDLVVRKAALPLHDRPQQCPSLPGRLFLIAAHLLKGGMRPFLLVLPPSISCWLNTSPRMALAKRPMTCPCPATSMLPCCALTVKSSPPWMTFAWSSKTGRFAPVSTIVLQGAITSSSSMLNGKALSFKSPHVAIVASFLWSLITRREGEFSEEALIVNPPGGPDPPPTTSPAVHGKVLNRRDSPCSRVSITPACVLSESSGSGKHKAI